ncbi:heme-copper oxidase subunit III [Plantactinospora sp. KLBMP9567]|uniref:cytochrome c oxidase subunit 3 n=1 Tax=Plantactinospora sp. KLBMP9567 TaxID=3085900 RepID=UPI002982983E|nr:heme-copper oxidase subunit III [Plantactinospora sp. KLBMP9567]MDW5329662.1 heme-copper oxidase subunit III [Plantactinospora sp. KLBMP9567]
MTTRSRHLALGPHGLATEEPVGRSTAWWGVMLFIATESTLFAALFGSYFYLRFQHGAPWPPDGIGEPELFLPLIMTGVLVPSSLPLLWAEAGIRRGRRWQLRAGLLATLVMGGTFLGLQGMEYSEILREYTFTSNAYGSLFYTTTTFHGAHVTIGLLMVGWLLIASLQGSFGARRHERVRIVAYYWHFVDVVWVAILFTVYLSPRL